MDAAALLDRDPCEVIENQVAVRSEKGQLHFKTLLDFRKKAFFILSKKHASFMQLKETETTEFGILADRTPLKGFELVQGSEF